MLALALAALVASQAEEIPATRLVYLPGKWEGVCPTEVEVHEGVARRLGGRTPFAEPPTRIVVLALEGDDEQKPSRARTEMFDSGFTSLGARAIESSDGCRELVEAAELAISIALAPTIALTSTAPPEPKPIEPRTEIAPLEKEAAPVEPPKAPATPVQDDPDVHFYSRHSGSILPAGVNLVVGIGLDASLLFGPTGEVGAHLSGALRVDQLEFRLERREHLPSFSTTIPRSTMTNVLTGGSVTTAAPCGHLSLFPIVGDGDRAELSACATGSVGNVWAIGNTVDATTSQKGFYAGGSPYIGLGGRLGMGWTGKDLTAVRFWTEVELSIVRPEFLAINQTSPWKQDAPVTVTLGVSYEIPWAL